MSAPHAPSTVHVRVPGKINVYMNVGERQPDGYHDVATAYQAVSLYEDVRASHASDVTVSFDGTVDVADVPLGEANLAVRAARLLARRTGHAGGVRLEIRKHVPVSGGMGGGSADAAGALLACDILWGTGVGREELGRLAAELGADVPFALAGGTAIGTGRGDRLSPALAKGTFHWVLVPNEVGLSTPEVYGALDLHRERHAADIAPVAQAPAVDDGILQALRAGDPDLLAAHLHNDLQVAALKDRPDLAETLEVGESAGALAGIVSGSGPTVAFLARDADAARALLVDLSASGYDARHVTGPVAGARQVD